MNILTETIEVFATGIPKGQPRVKAFTRGRHAGVYDPGTANEWKAAVAHGFNGHHGKSFNQPLVVRIWLHLPRPKGHFGKWGLLPGSPVHHTGKPDLDNAAKAILDAMTDFQFWKDDSCCVSLTIEKSWTDSTPGARISISCI